MHACLVCVCVCVRVCCADTLMCMRVCVFPFQLSHHDRVDSLVLVNPYATQAGWVEWGYQKVSVVA